MINQLGRACDKLNKYLQFRCQGKKQGGSKILVEYCQANSGTNARIGVKHSM